MTGRDEFTKRTIDTLADRAGNRCSNPACRQLTSGPHDDLCRSVNVGVGAHITAASLGGPRYDPSLTVEQRKSIDNGIWLCQKCAHLVDSDEQHYSVQMLHDWKVQAEAEAQREVEGKRKVFVDDDHPKSMPGNEAPRPLLDFVGREATIKQLTQAARPCTRLAITGVVGMGGVGKTELAKVVASRVCNRFRDGVLWADLGHETAVAVIDRWAGQFGRQITGQDLAARSAAWRGLVSGKEALLVLDNVQYGQDVEPLLPGAGRSAVLIITRYMEHPALRGAAVTQLDQFTPAEALSLAERVLGQAKALQQAGDAKEVFERVGYLPLGVAVALHAARRGGWSLVTLNGKLEAAGALAVLGDDNALHKSLNATFETAWQGLPDDLRSAFATLSVFNKGPSFGTDALAATLALEAEEASARLHRLVGQSLLTELREGRWALHPLLREFAKRKAVVHNDALRRMARHYLQVVGIAEDLYELGGEEQLRGLALFDQEWPHIRVGQAWAAAHADDDDDAADQCSNFAWRATNCLMLRLHARDQIAWHDAGARAAAKLGNRGRQGTQLATLANAYRQLGERWMAIGYYRQALAIHREICLAPSSEAERTAARQGEGYALAGLGGAHLGLGEARRAIEYYEQALIIRREICATCQSEAEWRAARRGEGFALGGLGNAYLQLGEAQRAIEHYGQALAIRRDIGDRRGEGHDLGSLGRAHAELGEAQCAIDYYEQALTIHRLLGDRRGEGYDLAGLGSAHAKLGEAPQAIEYYGQALEIAREIGDRRGEGLALASMGSAYKKLGDVAHARQRWAEAQRIYERIGDPNAGQVRRWLADIANNVNQDR